MSEPQKTPSPDEAQIQISGSIPADDPDLLELAAAVGDLLGEGPLPIVRVEPEEPDATT